MTVTELREYVKHLRGMIHVLQETNRKLLALHPTAHGANEGTSVKDGHIDVQELP